MDMIKLLKILKFIKILPNYHSERKYEMSIIYNVLPFPIKILLLPKWKITLIRRPSKLVRNDT